MCIWIQFNYSNAPGSLFQTSGSLFQTSVIHLSLQSNIRFTPLQVSSEDVKCALRTFSEGSSGGPDSLTLQNITDLLAGDSDERVLNALTGLVNLMLADRFNEEINTVIFGDCLLAMSNKDGRVQPITVGYVLPCLVTKCASSHVNEQKSKVLKPKQLGVGVAEEDEVAIHAMCNICGYCVFV